TAGCVGDEPGEPVAEIEDLIEVAGTRAAHRRRLDDGRDDVAGVGDPRSQLLGELLLEAGIADRRRPHVDAAAPGAEVERRADDGNLTGGLLHAHGAEATGRWRGPDSNR